MAPPLARVLVVKMALTLSLWVVPLLCLPASWLRALGFSVPEPIVFLRLLGMAYAALLVGYALGLREVMRGGWPATVVWVGLASNGGACAVLGWFALRGEWSGWGALAQATMWSSLLATGGITASLWYFGLLNRPLATAARHPGG